MQKKKIDDGFSIVELVISISLGTMLISFLVTVMFVLSGMFLSIKAKGVKNFKRAELAKELALDVLNVDLYPRKPAEEYSFEVDRILFYSNGNPVEYYGGQSGFSIDRDGETESFDFISDFEIEYYDEDEYRVDSEDFPYYCLFKFTFDDKKQIDIRMRL